MATFNAVVFDWAGTILDFGSFAPTNVFIRCFEEFGIAATIAQARGPMGLPKRDHIKAMMSVPEIADQWLDRFGAPPGEADIDKVYEIFVPMNEKVAAEFATLVPGAAAAVETLRDMGLKIGSTTGYTRSIMQHVLPVAAKQGYRPDNLVCADDLPEGRPGPLGIYKCFLDLVVHPPETVVKVDDTAPGIAEGVAAGCLTVGVALSGNYVGKTVEELETLAEAERASLRGHATEQLLAAGADHVIDTVADLPDLIRSLSY